LHEWSRMCQRRTSDGEGQGFDCPHTCASWEKFPGRMHARRQQMQAEGVARRVQGAHEAAHAPGRAGEKDAFSRGPSGMGAVYGSTARNRTRLATWSSRGTPRCSQPR